MNIKEHKNRDGMKVWLSVEELQTLVEYPDDVQKQISLKLAGYCGLRSEEVLNAKPALSASVDRAEGGDHASSRP